MEFFVKEIVMSVDIEEGYEETVSREDMRGPAGQWALQRFLGNDHQGMRARPEARGYRVDGLDARSLRKLLATRLVGAYHSTFEIHPDAHEYVRLVRDWVDSGEQLVFVPIEEGKIRVYHFRE